MCQLIETIQVKNGIPLLLPYHQTRMDRSVKSIWKCKNKLVLDTIITIPEHAKTGIWKCRIVYSNTTYSIDFTPYTYRKIETLQCVEHNAITYEHKYENRQVFQELLHQKDRADEIIIIKNNLITDTSFSNIMFFNGTQWLTPSDCLLPGTKRSYLLDTKQIFEQKIYKNDVNKYQKARLLNCFFDLHSGNDIKIENIVL